MNIIYEKAAHFDQLMESGIMKEKIGVKKNYVNLSLVEKMGAKTIHWLE